MRKDTFSFIMVITGSFFLSSCISADRAVSFSQPDGPRYARIETADYRPGPDKKTIRVVSYNIALCRKIKGVRKFLRKNQDLANADIICLQEMNREGVESLAGSLNYNYVYYPSAVHPCNNKDFGQAILSRWPIKNDRKILLPYSFQDRYIKMQRCAVGATVLVNHQEILVFSVHLGVIISAEHRKGQIQAVIDAIAPQTAKCIIAGDFNTYAWMHTRAVTQALTGAGFELATKDTGWTYKYWYLFNRKTALDYIFYKGLKLIRAGTIADRAYSDHLPVWAEFVY